jgi:transcriptional regulator with XRE-family HTH domain
VWADYIERAQNTAMAELGNVARRRGLSMRTVAGRVGTGINVRALQRFFEAREPRVETLTAVAKALDLDEPGLLARAFCNRLNADDVRKERAYLEQVIKDSTRIFGTNTSKAALRFREACSDNNACNEACAQSILERNGFHKDLPSSAAVAILLLGRPLAIAAEVLHRRCGFNIIDVLDLSGLFPPDAWHRDLEVLSWVTLLRETFGYPESPLMPSERLQALEQWSKAFSTTPEGAKLVKAYAGARRAAQGALRAHIKARIRKAINHEHLQEKASEKIREVFGSLGGRG